MTLALAFAAGLLIGAPLAWWLRIALIRRHPVTAGSAAHYWRDRCERAEARFWGDQRRNATEYARGFRDGYAAGELERPVITGRSNDAFGPDWAAQ